ncbi:MAG: sodium/proton-translocating pyrophosphatase, partial [Fimbriimonadaceae bacterium]|nr:sodium/proton-translocating pyrophosphatase [Fimbriimonadaceae bacterium]
MLAGLPAASMAAGGENVRLNFTTTDYIYLGVSLAFGVISIAVALGLRSWVLKQSPGPESMQTVGQAIIDGAMAYLKQQVRTMSVFVVIIFALLTWMYWGTYGPVLALATAACFVAGVAASYTAGYVGMGIAVRANMRTAFAALSSYPASLQVAFRSGAVAGLITVGMGLVGATLIFLFFAGDAMKLLVGFGFGGSLAALFMRVGGGIYTKAADVGADLVGKVEAGIPEDDPRNPAVIADNVGDNVGDCAGMAADVFESYEVTLVAAIILGAATAALFDTATWTKLVMFALMARGVGILASIIGIFAVKPKEGEEDPLKPISRGYTTSLVTAAVMTAVLAFLMMGGLGGSALIRTNQLVTTDEVTVAHAGEIYAARDRAAKELGVPAAFVSAQKVEQDPTVQALIPDEQSRIRSVSAVLAGGPEISEPRKLEGFTKIDFADPKDPHANLAVAGDTPGTFATLKSKVDGKAFKAFEVTLKADGQEQKVVVGPTLKEDLDKTLEDARQQQAGQPGAPELTVTGEFDIAYYANNEGRVVMGVVDPGDRINPALVQPLPGAAGAPSAVLPLSLSQIEAQKAKVDEDSQRVQAAFQEMSTKMQAAQQKLSEAKTDEERAAAQAEINALSVEQTGVAPTLANPQPRPIEVARVVQKVVPWWTFVLCIVFGIIMAFVFEKLTDYYVSMHKRPVQEIGAVATTGPAPMIITGFAYGKESSVFSVVAIVACLIAPLLIFPPGEYGGYLLSFYGIALVGLGLLTTTGYILAMDTFGPISDNAQGVYEMSGEGHDNAAAARSVQLLDAAGNTTKALTKGFAIATAVVAAVALFHAFVEAGRLTTAGMRLEVPEIFLGLLLGGAAPYLFSAFSIQAVGRAAFQLINEVRRQFREDAGIMAGTSKPDYGRCVAIVTAAAQKELLGPGILAIAFPMVVAFGFAIGKEPTYINGQAYNLVGAQALGGFLAGTILSGQLLAVTLAQVHGGTLTLLQ